MDQVCSIRRRIKRNIKSVSNLKRSIAFIDSSRMLAVGLSVDRRALNDFTKHYNDSACRNLLFFFVLRRAGRAGRHPLAIAHRAARRRQAVLKNLLHASNMLAAKCERDYWCMNYGSKPRLVTCGIGRCDGARQREWC